jgi:LPS export ABC transporter protein LptC
MRNAGIFILIGVLLIAGCAQKKEEPLSESERAELLKDAGIEQKVLAFDLTAYTDRGAKRWEVKGTSANVVDNIVELEDLIARTYGEENTLTLTADGGTYDKVAGTIHLENNVVITTSDGARVLTDVMDWDSKNNVITTDSLVTIEREAITLWGRGTRGEPELKKVQFLKDIRVEMDKGATVITCDGPLDVDYENNVGAFNNNVKIVDEKGEVTSDTLDAYLNPETKAIVKAIARGEVKIVRGDNYSESEEAIYLAEEHKVVLTGRPTIVFYPDEKFEATFLGEAEDGQQ